MIAEADAVGSCSHTCRCNCGYTCGGPGVCELFAKDPNACVEAHFVQDCEHDFSGPVEQVGAGAYSAVCSKCGMSALLHDSMCGP
jgi:hypothetical protein